MSTNIYDHLLTCELRSATFDNINKKLEEMWEKSHVLNAPPLLYGPSPSITVPQVAFLLASYEPFAEKFLRPDMLRLFRLAVNEAKASLVSNCRTNPTIETVFNSAIRANQYPIGSDTNNPDDGMDDDSDDDLDAHDDQDAPERAEFLF